MTTVAQTRQGAVRGKLAASTGVVQWRGIPYAAPPVGEGRFRPPQPPARWAGERDATQFGPVAVQSRDPRAAMMSGITDRTTIAEDCLVLNVFSPGADDARRPVVVWIHGGAFIMGSGSQPLYNGTPFVVDHDLVVVTINYRLGVLGFLYLGELAPEHYPAGNVALLDQVAALRWVRDNIAGFGGDPDRVTVMGESAGAFSVGALLAMPAARGLFQRAILQSGAATLAPPSRADATEVAQAVLARLGIPSVERPEGRAALAALPVARILAAQEALSRAHGLAAFWPYLDGATLPRDPIEAVRTGEAPRIPLLLGSNRDEWTLFDVFFGAPATAAVRRATERWLGADAARVHARYRAARADRSDAAAWVDLAGDAVFRVPMIRLAEAHAPHAATWMYRFDWATSAFEGRLGATHALELPFVWSQLESPFGQLLLGGDLAGARALGAPMHASWAAFIRDGDPNGGGLPAWPRYDAERRATMLLDRSCRVVDDPGGDQRVVWPR